MLVFSARSGALAQRIGPRIPLTVGPLVIARRAADAWSSIDPGDGYLTAILPAVIVFGLGLTLVVAPVTATVLAAADTRHSGIASGVNNAVARVGGLLAVAVLPLAAGLTGDSFYDPAQMTDGFHMAMVVCAVLVGSGRRARLGDDLLRGPATPSRSPAATPPTGSPPTTPAAVAGHSAAPRAGGRVQPELELELETLQR